MKFGMFMSPLHAPGQSPAVALTQDLDIVQHMDRLGFDEVWVGEHHSGGVEPVSSPEVFLAAAAQRTQDIKLGTGVVSVPYHHPLVTAGRLTLLDQLSRGRIMFGAGPGALVTDAHMMGIDPNKQRAMLAEGLEAIYRLLNGETVSMKTDWFTLEDARLQVLPYKGRKMDMAVASVRSPSGVNLAGRYGLGLLSIAATDSEGGFAFIKDTWQLMEERAELFGQTVDRSNWRLMIPMHLAATKEQAYEEARHGMVPMMRWGSTGPFSGGDDIEQVIADTPHDVICDGINALGHGVIGTPDMAIAAIKRLEEQSGGGFGTVLLAGIEWADFEARKRSLEMFAQYVMPEFHGTVEPLVSSWDHHYGDRAKFGAEFRTAQDQATAQFKAENPDSMMGASPRLDTVDVAP
jgi:limonene 1,2-monooxygenase